MTLLDYLSADGSADGDALLEAFLAHTEDTGRTLYPAQEEAILALFAGQNVVLNTPTGSGKSLVAQAMAFKAVAEHKRCFYTAPIKALVSEKFFDACRVFGAEQVGMMTGDASVNSAANLVFCTAEILAQIALREGEDAAVDYVVMDEFHFYADRDRGNAWQLPLLILSRARFLLMSATLGEPEYFCDKLEELTSTKATLVQSRERPVPLSFRYSEDTLHSTLSELIESALTPVYIVHFTQRSASERAQDFMSINLLSKDEKKRAQEEMRGVRFDSPFGKELRRFLGHGIGVHHAGLLPKYRTLVERMAQKGLLRIVCGTDTLGVGINVPIRTVLFTQLCKYDGEKTRVLSVRDFQQISGRAGRKGFDDEGLVVAQAPEHVVENRVLERKTAGDPKKRKKAVFRKPPERGYAHWDEQTFDKLQRSESEALSSRFAVDHGMVLEVLSRKGGGCAELKKLIRRSHDPRHIQNQHLRSALRIFRSLLDHDVLGMDTEGVYLKDALPDDISLNRSLSLFVLSSYPLFAARAEEDGESEEDAALAVLSLIECAVENPDAILRKQLDKKRGDLVNKLKAEGYEYDARMEALEQVEIDKPEAEFIYACFNDFREGQPWLAETNVAPKSVARDMYERGLTFVEYVKEYGLARSEGLLLRYLSDAYKMLTQTLPEDARSDALEDIVTWLGGTVRDVDSSFLDEWEKLQGLARGDTADRAAHDKAARGAASDDLLPLSKRPQQLERLIRAHMRSLLQALSRKQWTRAEELAPFAPAIEEPSGDEPTTVASTLESTLETALAPFFDEYQDLRLDGTGLSKRLLSIEVGPGTWTVTQTLPDPERHHEWRLCLEIDLKATNEKESIVARILEAGTQ